MVNTILKEADLFCPNSVRINFTIYQVSNLDKFYNRLNIDETQLTNDNTDLWGQVWRYIHDSEVGRRIYDIENTQDKEANDQLEKDYGVRVVFSDKD